MSRIMINPATYSFGLALCLLVLGCGNTFSLRPISGPAISQELRSTTPKIENSGMTYEGNLKDNGRLNVDIVNGDNCQGGLSSSGSITRLACSQGREFILSLGDRPSALGLGRDYAGNFYEVRMPFRISPLRGCMNESLSYASSMASCLARDRNNDGNPDKTQDECETESAPSSASFVQCQLGQIEILRKEIIDFVRPPFPGPGPGPIPFSQ